MTRDELTEVVRKHGAWKRGEAGGVRANLTEADLTGANLLGANLTEADLTGANLTGANLTGANLWRADLWRANLTGANLTRANLTGANLTGANLTGADLTGANLSRADLTGADLWRATMPHYQIPDGDLIGWKKVDGHIIKLRIPEAAKRTASYVGRKYRAEYADVLSIEGAESVTSRPCDGVPLCYTVGARVTADSYDDDPRVECSHGIHFFATRQEAEEWKT